jgi:hypothetical protein
VARMRFKVMPVSGICDCCFTNRTICVPTFVISYIVRMDCLVTGLTFVAILQNAQYPLVLCVIKVFGVSAFLVIRYARSNCRRKPKTQRTFHNEPSVLELVLFLIFKNT